MRYISIFVFLLSLLATTAQNGTVGGENHCFRKNLSYLLEHIDEEILNHLSTKIETKAMVANVQDGVNKLVKQLQDTNTRMESFVTQLNKLDENVGKVITKGDALAAKLDIMEISCNQNALLIEQKLKQADLASTQKPLKNWQVLLQEVRAENGIFFTTQARRIYYLVEAHINWFDARDACLRKGMKHATPRSQEELNAVAGELRRRGFYAHSFWLSASDIGHSPGQFYWADGHAVESSLWTSGEPNNFGSGKESCVELNTGNGKLIDLPCAPLYWSILCEVL